MSTPRWTISINNAAPEPLAAAKIAGYVIEYVSRGTDTATLTAHPSTTWNYGDTVSIYLDGARRFLGRVTTPQLDRAGGSRLLTVPVLGVQDWLTRITYRQFWAVHLGDGLGQVPSSRVILNASGPDTHLSADGQVADIINYASSRGAPLAFGSSAIGITLPFHEDRDLACRQALETVLRLTPSVAEWVDYTQTTPTLHYGTAGAFTAARVERDSVAYRRDLIVPGLQIEIERIHNDNGTQYRTIETLEAGDTGSLDAVFLTLPMAGSERSSSTRRVNVQTEDLGHNIHSASWWKEKHPFLADIALADIDLLEAGRPAGWGDYPRISSTPLPDLQAAGKRARLETIWAVVNIIRRDGGDVIKEEKNINLEMQFITTDAITRTYQWIEAGAFVSAETTPSGLAAGLFAHWSRLYAQGSFSCTVDDGLPHPGQTILGTPIQTVQIDVITNTITGTFGPPSRLSAQEFVAFLNQARSHRLSVRFSSRFDARPPVQNESDADIIAPAASSTWSPGKTTLLAIKAPGKSITLDPGALDDGKTASMQEWKQVDDEGNEDKFRVLATKEITIEPGGLPKGTADNMILRWDHDAKAWKQIGGYEEKEVVLYTREKILNGQILFKPAEESAEVAYSPSQHRLILQVVGPSSEAVLTLDHGHFADTSGGA